MPEAVSADATPDSQFATVRTAPDGRAEPAHRAGSSDWSWPRFTRNALIIAAAIALGTWFIVESAIPNLVPKRFGTVVEGRLYRSGELTPMATRTVVERHGIATIIDLGAHEPGSTEERRAQATADALGVTRHRFSLYGDATGDPNEYVHALRLALDPANQPVLIHCAAGSQRTGCAIALFRMIEEDWTLDRAIEEARLYDHDPADNPHVIGMIERHGEDVERSLESGDPIDLSDG